MLKDRPDLTAYEKPDAGFTIRVVPPGKPSALYHAESVQEDFLVLMGECVLNDMTWATLWVVPRTASGPN